MQEYSEVESISVVEYKKELEICRKDLRELLSDIEEVKTIYTFPSTEEEAKENASTFAIARQDTIQSMSLMR